jgi:adenylate cyclase
VAERQDPRREGLILQKFRRQIRDGSVSFLFAHDGVEALAMLDGNRDVDMVLSDIDMPRMDGLSLLGRLQEGDENPSTVIVSAYGDMANIRTALNRGAFDFVTKPIDFVDPHDLGRKVTEKEKIKFGETNSGPSQPVFTPDGTMARPSAASRAPVQAASSSLGMKLSTSTPSSKRRTASARLGHLPEETSRFSFSIACSGF